LGLGCVPYESALKGRAKKANPESLRWLSGFAFFFELISLAKIAIDLTQDLSYQQSCFANFERRVVRAMRSCPTCQRTYPDDNLTVCQYDGTQLSQPFYAQPPPYQQAYGAPQQPPPGAYPMPPPPPAYGAPPPGAWQGNYPPPAYVAAPPGAGQYRPCPKCQRPDPEKVGFTWWGGVIGPRMLSHVKCRWCGTQYNGKTGQSNTTGIVVYLLVGLAIGLVILLIVISR